MDSDSRNRPEEDWGCVGPDELFFFGGPTPSLRLLLEQFEKTRHNNDEMPSISKLATGLTSVMDSDAPRREVKIAKPLVIKHEMHEQKGVEEVLKTSTAGILKKGTPADNDGKAINLKRVSFEIERFVAANLENRDERFSAEQQLVVKLGAKAPPQKAINYKQLKEQRREAKRNLDGADSNGSHQFLIRGINGKGRVAKKQKDKKKGNGSGRPRKGAKGGRGKKKK